MAEWKNEIRKLAIDFCINRQEVLRIFRVVEDKYGDIAVPSFYKGDRNEFLYDKAQREMMNRIYA